MMLWKTTFINGVKNSNKVNKPNLFQEREVKPNTIKNISLPKRQNKKLSKS